MHLLSVGREGWLELTPDFLRAYLTRPEIHPVENSCAAEIALHEALMDDPRRPVAAAEIARLADADAIDNYTVLLAFRDHLLAAGTIEGAYLRIVRTPDAGVPSVFLDQLVHVILRNVMKAVVDPLRIRAAEIFFREQTVSTDAGRVLLADQEVVDMHAKLGRESGLGQLLAETGTPLRTVSLDVLSEDNAAIYWTRSDRFDTVVDLRYGEPALDALARVIEMWIAHLTGAEVRVEPRPKLDDDDWRWHIGLDREATAILNAIYRGEPPPPDAIGRIIALFRMRFTDESRLLEHVKGKPVYLALAMTEHNRLRMKPQNLIVNLPLAVRS